jgi:exopolysaccharide biosynthesis protein
MIVEIILAIETVMFIVEGYVIWNLMKKTELLETWVETFTQRIEKVQTDLKQIDYMGSFEADDEIGTIFGQIKDIISELDELKGEEVDAS